MSNPLEESIEVAAKGISKNVKSIKVLAPKSVSKEITPRTKKRGIEMAKKLDTTRPVQTRDGRPARILCTDFMSIANAPLVVAIAEAGGEHLALATENGRRSQHEECPADILNVPEKVTLWVNIHRADNTLIPGNVLYPNEDTAKEAAGWSSYSYVATVPVTFEVPE